MSVFQKPFVNSAISWLFLGYFLILFAERAQSLVRIGRNSFGELYKSGFDGYVDTLSMLSLLSAAVLLLFFCRGFWPSLTHPEVQPDYSMLTITAGVLLVSGMVHTENTVAPIQFAAYGMLIVAMVLRALQLSSGTGSRFTLWYSLIFLTVFSMAIPVMYRSEISNATLFHIIEAAVSLLLVICFTWMLRDLFLGQGSDLLRWVPMILAAAGDAVILAMRWQESVNTFVLIFLIASLVLFAAGKILFALIR